MSAYHSNGKAGKAGKAEMRYTVWIATEKLKKDYLPKAITSIHKSL
jgi:hypothetical protein